MDVMRTLFLVAVLALPFVGYALVALTRKARYRSLASKLGATHIDRGWFVPGAIAGERFEIEAAQVGKSYRTRLRVDVGGTPGCFLLRPGFFGESPDWAFAWVPGARNERVFLWEVAVRRLVEPTREQRDRLLHWLARSSQRAGLHEVLAAAGIREIFIDDGSISVRFRGIVSNLARLQRTLEALRRLAPDDRAPAATDPARGRGRTGAARRESSTPRLSDPAL